MTYAKIIADSVSAIDGIRLTTFEVRFHRFVLAEFNTHRVFSRNSASSRAIPFEKQISRLRESIALPVEWATEQKGMQGGPPLSDETEIAQANANWELAMEEAIGYARALRVTGDPDSEEGTKTIHKSLVNRLLEPFMWHTVVVTSTAWENFFAQRCSPLAQPEIRVVADMMKEAHDASSPTETDEHDWHLPYIRFEDHREAKQRWYSEGHEAYLAKISAARCARVSYLTQDGRRDLDADLELYERLVTARPAHWSPLEHAATPWPENRQEQSSREIVAFTGFDGCSYSPPVEHLPRVGNLLGWRSLRTTVEAAQGEVTFR